MSMLSFKRANDRQFELHIGFCGTGLLWPCNGMLEWFDRGGHLVESGLDIESEYMGILAETFATQWEPYKVNMGMTRLEIVMAYGAAKQLEATQKALKTTAGKVLSSRA